MSDKSRSGCVGLAVIGVLALIGGVFLVATIGYKAVSAGKREVQSHLEDFKAREEARAAEEESKIAAAVQLKEGELADYSGYRSGDPLSRELFLAWRLDQGATTLAKEVFVKNAEGAEVVWELQAGDLQPSGNQIAGDFYLPYWTVAKGGSRQSRLVQVTCHFAEGTRDTLLGIRRGAAATLRGKLSLVNDRVVLNEARLATEEVEK